jgi:hypothetical protein
MESKYTIYNNTHNLKGHFFKLGLSNSPIYEKHTHTHALSLQQVSFYVLKMQVMETLRHVSLARLSRETATSANAQKMG